MSDASIFIVGSVLFIATAWATFAVGLSWFSGLQLRDAQGEPSVSNAGADSATTPPSGDSRRDTSAGPQR